ncbi:unnamed protein product, partial [Rhizoctonia solani]
RWVELWTTMGDVLRIAVPLGLNTRPGFRGDGTTHTSDTPETLLPDPANCVEQETRVNLFWVAYANERLSEAPGSWAMCLDDQDIHQLLPGDLSHFEAGHANLYSPNCQSAWRLVAAARAILDLMYIVCSTSYDITRLPLVCVQCWGRSASVLIRLYKLEISRGRQEEALAIDLEIQSIRFTLNQMGTRLPMALKHNKAIDFELETECGQIVRVYSISQQGPSPEGEDTSQISVGSYLRLGSRSKWAPEVTIDSAGQLQSASVSRLGVNTNDSLLSFASLSPSVLDTFGHSFTSSL